MADAPWRCSQCGTVNEPVANACRTCGRWPSLFDLERTTMEGDAPLEPEPELYEHEAIETEYAEPEVYDVGEPPAVDGGEDDGKVDEAGPPKPRWQRFVRLIVPIGVVLYILISALANRGG